MTYTPQTWLDGSAGGTPISAARLNFMEGGIAAANALAFHGETNYIDVAIDDITDTVTHSIDAAFKARVANLEAARSLVQAKDSLVGGGTANFMNFPGTTGNYISSPSNAAYDVAGDMAIAIRIKMPASAPGSDEVLVSRRGSSTATTQFAVWLKTTGQLQFTISVNGTSISTAATTAASPLVFDGNWIWLRFIRIASTGQCSFYTGPDTGSNSDIPAAWTTFQTNRGTTVGALITGTAAPVEISGYDSGSTSMFAGQIGRALMFASTSTAGTPLFDANASDYTSGTTWTDPQTRVWTIAGTASVTIVGGAVASTSSEFTLSMTDAFPSLPFNIHDTLMWSTEASLVNTSGGNVNFTPKLKVAGVDLFLFPALVLPSAAAAVYNLGCAVKLVNNAVDGTTQIARAQLVVAGPGTGNDLGSSLMVPALSASTNLFGNRSGALATMTSIPQLQLNMTHGTSAATVSSRHLLTQLFMAKG